MANDLERLNRYEIELNEQLTKIMEQEDKNFSVFLRVLIEGDVPKKSSTEYFKVLKKEQMKLRRGSLSIQEVHDMLEVLNWEFQLTMDGKPLELKKYSLDDKVRFTDLMRVCELLGIEITYSKCINMADRRVGAKIEGN